MNLKIILKKFSCNLILNCLLILILQSHTQALPPSSDNITLLECIDSSLKNSHKILSSREDIKYSKGAAMGAESAFDSTISAGAGLKKTQSPLNHASEKLVGKDTIETTETSYRLSYLKELESGLIINPYISTTSSKDDNPSSNPETRTGAYLSFTLPLLKGLGKPNTALKKASYNDIENQKFALKQTITDSVHETILAYWHYVMNFQNYQHYKLREKRALNLYTQTKALVEADEIPGSELDQASANLWDKKTSLISAEESLTQSLASLYTSMGLKTPDSIEFLKPEDDFNLLEIRPATIDRLEPSELISLAAQKRFDIKESLGRETTLISKKLYYKDQLRQNLNLGFQLGYESLKEETSAGAMLKSPYSHVTGPSFKISLNWDLPIENNAAKGNLILQEALLDKQRINSREIEKRMRNQIITSVYLLKKNILELKNAEKTIGLYKKAFKNQEIKFKMGMETQLDLINSQDRINNADLNLISAKYKYAVTIARLRYETATLVSFKNEKADISIKDIVSIPGFSKEKGAGHE